MSARLAGIAPWSGLIAAGLGWGMHHQVVTDSLHFDCSATDDGTGLAWGLFAMALILAGAFLSWRAKPARDERGGTAAMRAFVVNLSLMATLLAVLGVVFNIIAVWLLPGCAP